MKRLIILILLLSASAVIAQDTAETQEPEPIDYAFEFPLPVPTDNQINEAYNCVLTAEETEQTATEEGETTTEDSSACDLANQALSLVQQRGDDAPSEKELRVFYHLIEENPALALRLSLIAAYFNTSSLVAPPEAALKPITSVHFTYTFSGLGPSNDYDVTITNADTTPAVTGEVSVSGSGGDSDATEESMTLPETIDSELVQALGPAISDLLPIETQFSSVPCWDYYPDWVVELTFEDDTTLTLVTNQSNVVGIGGPWQVEIDSQTYMQYSGAISDAMRDLFDALDLPLGETGAMGCGGVTEPLHDAFPREETSAS